MNMVYNFLHLISELVKLRNQILYQYARNQISLLF